MEAPELQNANPTILSAAQLPSRRKQKHPAARRGVGSKYDDLLSFKHSAVPWGSSRNISSWPSDEEDDDAAELDEFREEPIDEQEIYGKRRSETSLSLSLSL